MAETYFIKLVNGTLEFIPNAKIPEWALERRFNPDAVDNDTKLVCRMGDPDLIHCIIFQNKAGGIFAIHGKDNLLFAAMTDNNLTFAIAQGYFGEITANARYGVDVFENMELPDD